MVEEEVLRCIQIGLVCVQENVEDRPTTEAVALMLATTTMEIPQPEKPNYFYAKFLGGTASEPTITQSSTINQVTLSAINGR
ncbi:G-type lectin S-receptor-like serine/threonine-protein kinase SRK [Cardamine amara subsp. amara]|uniref:G-type lectin S-receptor-like serine/threonine-protein kinase SRK n=1 Tax=Cardamine amara subsp. amara TaxID=228776 RepID=A0ABD0ZLU5_CARAN